jgi:tRNA C32,U32 (ribose-2'-O)-methylase TrmJ
MPGDVRSLNLANAVSVVLYEGLRQLGVKDLPPAPEPEKETKAAEEASPARAGRGRGRGRGRSRR